MKQWGRIFYPYLTKSRFQMFPDRKWSDFRSPLYKEEINEILNDHLFGAKSSLVSDF